MDIYYIKGSDSLICLARLHMLSSLMFSLLMFSFFWGLSNKQKSVLFIQECIDIHLLDEFPLYFTLACLFVWVCMRACVCLGLTSCHVLGSWLLVSTTTLQGNQSILISMSHFVFMHCSIHFFPPLSPVFCIAIGVGSLCLSLSLCLSVCLCVFVSACVSCLRVWPCVCRLCRNG